MKMARGETFKKNKIEFPKVKKAATCLMISCSWQRLKVQLLIQVAEVGAGQVLRQASPLFCRWINFIVSRYIVCVCLCVYLHYINFFILKGKFFAMYPPYIYLYLLYISSSIVVMDMVAGAPRILNRKHLNLKDYLIDFNF